MRKQPHSIYCSLLIFTIILNLVVYLQFTESTARTTKNQTLTNVELNNGDLVLRDTKGLLSTVFRNASLQEKKFTHAGLLHKSNTEWFVYHFMDGDNNQNGLHIEPLSKFINSDKCSSYAIYRYTLNSKQLQGLDSIISDTEKQVIVFDSDFNLKTDDAMYCTEWIAKTLEKVTDQKDFIAQTTFDNYTYIAPDNLYLNIHCQFLYQDEY
jgi:hypothetical protein